MSVALRWSAVLLAAAAVDLVIRFGFHLDPTRVLWMEAVLFTVTGLVLFALMRGSPSVSRGWKRARIMVIALFLLAGLRSGLWASGVPISKANLVVLAVAVLAWLAFRFGSARRTNPPG